MYKIFKSPTDYQNIKKAQLICTIKGQESITTMNCDDLKTYIKNNDLYDKIGLTETDISSALKGTTHFDSLVKHIYATKNGLIYRFKHYFGIK